MGLGADGAHRVRRYRRPALLGASLSAPFRKKPRSRAGAPRVEYPPPLSERPPISKANWQRLLAQASIPNTPPNTPGYDPLLRYAQLVETARRNYAAKHARELFRHYGIDEEDANRWQKLALSLAVDHVPACMVAPPTGGRPKKFNPLAAAYQIAELMREEKSHGRDIEFMEAVRAVKKVSPELAKIEANTIAKQVRAAMHRFSDADTAARALRAIKRSRERAAKE